MTELLAAAVLIGLAAYRVWRIIARDGITEPGRAPLIAQSDHAWARWTAELIGCAWCLGWWICGVIALALAVDLDWTLGEFAMVWAASSTVTGVIARGDN